VSIVLIIGCQKKNEINSSFQPIPLKIDLPNNFPEIEHPIDNPLTEQGVLLGRHLFWETKLSGDNSISCASCHLPENAFSDPSSLSVGIHGDLGTRNAMVLQNLAWSKDFFWDGSFISLEKQILIPVLDSNEMDETWSNFFYGN